MDEEKKVCQSCQDGHDGCDKLRPIDWDTGKYTCHIVKKGENLHTIAKMYHCTWKIIYKLNKGIIGKDPGLILPDMVLRIPVR